MKIHSILLFTLLAVLAGCTADLPENGKGNGPQSVQVKFALTPTSANSNAWVYKDGEGDEFIQDGFCVMIDATTQKVEHLFYCPSSHEGQNFKSAIMLTAEGGTQISTTVGRKLFYNFANLTQAQVEAAVQQSLGQADFHFKENETVDTAKINQTALAVSADGFTPSTTQGIPMSGKQEVSISASDNGQIRTLNVVRMMGKLQLDFTNRTSAPVTVESVTLENLADNPSADKPNLMLFPFPVTPTTGDGANVTVKPNLTLEGKQHFSPHTYTVGKNLAVGETTTLKVYVNETDQPNTQFEQFILSVKLRTQSGTTEQRYSLVSDESDDWSYIARNDWRHIPIIFHDYLFELIPQDFPPIGVLPSSVKEADGTFTCTFHAGGDFHLQPRITNRATGQVVTNWTPSDVTWETLVDNTTLYKETPYWYGLGGYVHGCFNWNATGKSVHILRLTAEPEGVTARDFTAPVIINREN